MQHFILTVELMWWIPEGRFCWWLNIGLFTKTLIKTTRINGCLVDNLLITTGLIWFRTKLIEDERHWKLNYDHFLSNDP